MFGCHEDLSLDRYYEIKLQSRDLEIYDTNYCLQTHYHFNFHFEV